MAPFNRLADRFLNRRAVPAYALPLLAVLFVALVVLSGWLFRGLRLDLTQNRQYTLSPGTLHIVEGAKQPVKLRLFYSETAARNYPQFRVFAQRVQELLQEISERSKGKIALETIDPEPFSDAEDEAASFGLRGLPLNNSGGSLYFGLVGSTADGSDVIMPFIHPDKEAFLEYDIAKLLASLIEAKPPVIGLLSDLPTGPNIDANGQPNLGWLIDQQLSDRFELRRLQANPGSIGDDVDLLMVVHPKQFSDDTLYAIDQFVLRGGRLLVFVDPDAETDVGGNPMDPASLGLGRSSDLGRLFGAWGIEYNPVQVVLDPQYALQVQPPDPNAAPVRNPSLLGLNKAAMNQRDVVSADLESVNLASTGSFSLTEDSPLKLEALLQSSSKASLSDNETVRLAAGDPSQLLQSIKPADSPFILAARLSGNLKTAFPERRAEKQLMQSVKTANMIVVADTDILSDRLWADVQNFLGQPIVNAFANNGDFVYNAVDNLIGNSDLIAVRTRMTARRPFQRVETLRRTAEQRYQTQERQLQQQLAELEQKLSALQPAQAEGAPPAALTAEQQAELQKFQKQKAQARRELRDVQHQLNADIDELGGRIKLINILAMPAIVILVAGFLAFRRRSQRRPA
ncbi:Gldg family protein [Arenimonas sp.]|uniref:GldG family protein n=1 Tax=Arenimonas sp. TaxID=1872635 RepID=UPI0039E440F9